MNKLLTGALSLALCAGMTVSALAAPILTDGAHTIYLGENNNLFLLSESDTPKVLRAPIADLIGYDAENAYCLSDTGRIYAIRLDGTATSVAASAPTEADVAARRTALPYALDEHGVLSLVNADGSTTVLAQDVEAACDDAVSLYYVTHPENSVPVLHSKALNAADAALHPAVTRVLSTSGVTAMYAVNGLVTMTTDEHNALVFDAGNPDPNSALTTVPLGADITLAVCVDGKLISYKADEQGSPVYDQETPFQASGSIPAPTAPEMTATPAATFTPRPTAVPTATPRPTARPTQKPSSDEDDGRISYGARGKNVRKMQQRLADLGYLDGSVDGVFGKDTLLALNLFQTAAGYKERKYASSALLKKLNAKDAPVFDPFHPCNPGDHNSYVLLMQTALDKLGYKLGTIDGIYGDKTTAALKAFQTAAGYAAKDVTGLGDARTLEDLYLAVYYLDHPTPAPTAEPTPTVEPTAAPTETPTIAPTEAPTLAPTEVPTQAPTATPAPTDPVATLTDLA